MTDADGMDHPPKVDPWRQDDRDRQHADWMDSVHAEARAERWDREYANIDGSVWRMNVVTKRQQLADEVRRHEAKLAAAQQHLAALDNIPDEDPFTDGTVLLVKWKQYTYVALRMRSFWYTTGRQSGGTVSGLYRVPWARFADWLVEGYVKELVEMAPVQTWPLVPGGPRSDEDIAPTAHLDGMPRVPCTIGNVHLPHVWYRSSGGASILADERAHCPGVGSGALAESYPGVAALLDKIKADPDRQPVTDPPEAYAHPGHMRIGGWCRTCGGAGDPAFIHSDVPSVEEERIQGLAETVALWKSVATQGLNGPLSESGIHVTCGLTDKHGAHLWASSNGGLVTCEGRLVDAPEKQS